MAQTGYTPISLYYSTTAAATPSAVNLANGELAINITDGKLYYKDNGGVVQLIASKAGAAGDVVGPASATDNAIVRFDGTTGKLVQNSVVTIADSTGDVAGVGALSMSGNLTLSGGTANGVLYLNGSKVATSGSALTFNGTQLTVGSTSAYGFLNIGDGGTTNYATAFYLNGTSNAANGTAIVGKRNGTDVWLLGDTAAALGSGTGYITYVQGDNPIISYINASEQMRLTSTGLGIGTSSPDQKVHAYNASSNTWFRAESGGDNSTGLYMTNNQRSWIWGVSGGGAGAMYLYDLTGSKEVINISSSGNLGLGVTPSASWSGQSAFQLGALASVAGSTNYTAVATNAVATSNGWAANYLANGPAALYVQRVSTGEHQWFTAPSGTAGNTISFTQAMTLDASGNLGVGTTSPSGRLHIRQSSIDAYFQCDNTGAVTLNFGGTTTPNKGRIFYTDNSDFFSFWTNSTERARITSGGDLLVGTTSTSVTSDTGIKFINSSAATETYMGIVTAATTNTATNYHLYSTGAAAFRFYVGSGGTVYATNTTISAISDQRFKENIQDLDVGLNAIMALKPRKFDWKTGKGKDKKDDRGFIAQEFEQVFPDLIDEWKDPAPEGEEPYKSVRQDLIPVLVKAIQEQQALIESLTSRVAQLEGTQP